MYTSRRRWLAACAGAVLLAVAGCTTTGTETTTTDSSTGTSSAQFPVTVTTAFGDVTIEKQPQRVVALGWSDAETALALGVQPVGASDWLAFEGDGQGVWAQGLYTTPPKILGTLEVDMEQVAALQPDLILDTRSSGKQERQDLLKGLGVPVVGMPAGRASYLTTWTEQLDLVGKALGKTAEAEALKTDLDKRFADAAAANPQFAGKTVSLISRTKTGYGAYVNSNRSEFMEKLGFVGAPELEKIKGENFSVQISAEQLNLLDADLNVVFMIGTTKQTLLDDKLFQAIPSVKAGHLVYLEDKTISTAFASASVLGLRHAIDKAVPLFATAAGS
ncbi:iron-siderophore ABC transporter substrate-binding protein [Actinoplanes couchii]|uniref:ABC transporter substrate-binding protein n=1 Tax=Actinoplanes couchii TaxID=403638 RepID=A0ABQ3X7U7_9ACTN|nr:iron-siderophore ABC transporter substrate-binding protein [Actinoplanes couchii]MDR6320398.1 iron complex transport system substrate-binding protein [Actinoplanes couchii]GID54590.1 ABC transporter substrate-binding protein [Actinoplanes couchii]